MMNYRASSPIMNVLCVAWSRSNRKARLEIIKARAGIILQVVFVHFVISVQQSGLQL